MRVRVTCEGDRKGFFEGKGWSVRLREGECQE